jgi:hypothetical protein
MTTPLLAVEALNVAQDRLYLSVSGTGPHHAIRLARKPWLHRQSHQPFKCYARPSAAAQRVLQAVLDRISASADRQTRSRRVARLR